MILGWRAVLLAGIFVGISACGRSETADDQPGAAGANEMANKMLADASNPFARAELAMTDEVAAAVGTDVSDTWLHKMVAHQRGAIGMAEVLLEQGGDARLLDMAQKTIDKQSREQVELQQLMGEITADPASALPYANAETHMHQAMMAARGRDITETWIRKMIKHHKGAIALSEIVLDQGENEDVKAKARQISEERRRDMAELETMLRDRGFAVTRDQAGEEDAGQDSVGARSEVDVQR